MRDSTLIKRYKEGAFVADIAEEAGVPYPRIMERLRELRTQKKLDVKRMANPNVPGKVDSQFKRTTRRRQERMKLVKKLRNDGRTNAEIAAVLEISVINVSKIVSKLIAAGELEARTNRFK